jgi:hypothetical protein
VLFPGEQAQLIAAAAGELAEGLPEAFRRAVRNNKVPRELHEDLWRLADKLQPLASAIARNAGKLPVLATRAAAATEQTADAASEVRLYYVFSTLGLQGCCFEGQTHVDFVARVDDPCRWGSTRSYI